MSGLIGQQFDRYQILERLGEGGMATVYKAYDARLDREVAIKVIRRDAFPPDQMEMLMKRFERESKSLAKLSHPNIVGVLDYGEFEGSPYLVMEYLSGGTLKDRLGHPLPWRQAVQMILPIASALEYVHDRNIINRDIKPSNVLMTDKGQPMLTDFGLVKVFGQDAKEGGTHLTSSGTGLGTPDYMAPEQWTGETTPQSDLYSLGVVLYEMITGHRPYTADTPAGVLLKQATEPLPLPTKYITDLPRDVESVVLKALAKDPTDRYPDVHTFLSELQNLLAGKEVQASLIKVETLRDQMTGTHRKISAAPPTPVTPTPTPAPAKSSTPLIPILAGVGVFGLIVIVGAFMFLANSGLFVAAPTITPTTNILPTFTETAQVLPTDTATGPTATAAPTEIAQPTETSFPTEIKDDKGVTMVYIPAGEFTMGSADTGDVGSKPATQVNLAAFYIDKYEVTNKLYDACVYPVKCRRPLNLGSAKPERVPYYGNPLFDDFPVLHVNWKMAKAYCEWRGARLPTEAEWEKAARGTDASRLYPWSGSTADCSFGNFAGCIGDTVKVGQYEKGKSFYGLYDMAGNVWEWTSSLMKPYPYIAADGREDALSLGKRIARGGGWSTFGGNAGNVRVDTRLQLEPGYEGTVVGIRCARSAP